MWPIGPNRFDVLQVDCDDDTEVDIVEPVDNNDVECDHREEHDVEPTTVSTPVSCGDRGQRASTGSRSRSTSTRTRTSTSSGAGTGGSCGGSPSNKKVKAGAVI